jgi:hypothetical protein
MVIKTLALITVGEIKPRIRITNKTNVIFIRTKKAQVKAFDYLSALTLWLVLVLVLVWEVQKLPFLVELYLLVRDRHCGIAAFDL